MVRARRWILLLLAVLLAASCVTFSATAAKSSGDAPAYKNLVPGTWGNAVTRLQKRLIELGYLGSGGADGEYGPKTVKAVRRFQSDNGLDVTGRADP